MELSCGSTIKSLTSCGRLVGLEVIGFGSGVFAADMSPHSTRPVGDRGLVVIVIG
jgi:hypothetical protein